MISVKQHLSKFEFELVICIFKVTISQYTVHVSVGQHLQLTPHYVISLAAGSRDCKKAEGG